MEKKNKKIDDKTALVKKTKQMHHLATKTCDIVSLTFFGKQEKENNNVQ